MTEPQEKKYWRLWGAACRRQGWNKAGGFTAKMADAKRKEIHAEVFHGPKSSKDINTKEDVDAIFARFRFLAGDLDGAIEDGAPEIGERRRLLDVIADHFKCARVYDPEDKYLKQVLAPRFKIVDGWSAIEDLSPEPTIRKNWTTGELEEGPSQLMQCVYTIARCVNVLRKKSGDTIHEMKMKAHGALVKEKCSCALCHPRRLRIAIDVNSAPIIAPIKQVPAPQFVSAFPEDENEPF